ncbi:MAG TPA: ATP synthase subunit I [Cellvibrionaceae bacterium]|nr:ATP synthase subunit I [Cellvibrionaceae bacterium]HNG59439.1 ATP synthase subunit I [Cellvibrionaceae bacterium]
MANPVWFCLSRQLCLMLVLLGLVSLVQVEWVVPAALGAALFIVPQLYFTHYTFRYRGLSNAALMVYSSKWGELGKFLLTVSGFALLWRFYPSVNVIVLMSVYGVFWLAQLFIANALMKTLPQ